jgi:hypothetical protein
MGIRDADRQRMAGGNNMAASGTPRCNDLAQYRAPWFHVLRNAGEAA